MFLSNYLFFFLLTLFIQLTYSLECYVCRDQEDNKDKCVETVKTCDISEDRCMAIVRWGSTPYWAPSGAKQFYISKKCSSKQNCDILRANHTKLCDRISYNDWKCVDCCHGDKCNYFITNSATKINFTLLSVLFQALFAFKLSSPTNNVLNV